MLPCIQYKPTRKQLIHLHKILCVNSATVPSNLGGGQNGHLVLMITLPEYNTQIKHAFIVPHKPGGFSPAPLPGVTLAQIAQINWVHEKSLQILHTYVNTNRVIKQQLQKAVYDIYLSAIKDYITIYANTCIHGSILPYIEHTVLLTT